MPLDRLGELKGCRDPEPDCVHTPVNLGLPGETVLYPPRSLQTPLGIPLAQGDHATPESGSPQSPIADRLAALGCPGKTGDMHCVGQEELVLIQDLHKPFVTQGAKQAGHRDSGGADGIPNLGVGERPR